MARRLVASLLVIGLAGTGLAFWLQGYRGYVVHTGSMGPTYVPGDVVLDKPPTGSNHRGDVITFLHPEYTDDAVLRRVVGVTPPGLIRSRPGLLDARVRNVKGPFCPAIGT